MRRYRIVDHRIEVPLSPPIPLRPIIERTLLPSVPPTAPRPRMRRAGPLTRGAARGQELSVKLQFNTYEKWTKVRAPPSRRPLYRACCNTSAHSLPLPVLLPR